MAHSTIQELKQKLTCPTFDTLEVGTLYYHYKNPQALYKILAIGLQEATEEPCIIYQSLDTELIWVRNINSWLEKVYYNNTWVPRFCKK